MAEKFQPDNVACEQCFSAGLTQTKPVKAVLYLQLNSESFYL